MKRILIVDNDIKHSEAILKALKVCGYSVEIERSGKAALGFLESEIPSLIISNISLPDISGYQFCEEIRKKYSDRLLPFIFVSEDVKTEIRAKVFKVGADEFLIKPVNKNELLLKVKSLLRVKELHNMVQDQAEKLEKWSSSLKARVDDQVNWLCQLQKFFSPQIAEMVLSSGNKDLLNCHRKEVTVVFVDLRGFTSFTETAEPEEVMAVLHEYYKITGNEAIKHSGTMGRLMGDGMMFFLNDPTEVPYHEIMGLKMADEIRKALSEPLEKWKNLGHNLDFAAGVASGYSTVGVFGFEKFWDYTVVGTTANLASRLCDTAVGGQILMSERFLHRSSSEMITAEKIGEIPLKGIQRPVRVYNFVEFNSKSTEDSIVSPDSEYDLQKNEG